MANIEEKDVNASILEGEESILDEVNELNKFIESEKLKQKEEDLKDTVKEKKSLTSKKVLPKEDKKVNEENKMVESKTELIKDSSVLKMERLHLRIVNDTIDILYRPNHCYVAFVPNDDNGKAEVKRVALMSREEFIEYLKKSTCFRFNTVKYIEEITRNSSDENWYKGAWSMHTKKILKELGVDNPVEEIIAVSK